MKNPQTTIAPTFLTHIISAIDGVTCFIRDVPPILFFTVAKLCFVQLVDFLFLLLKKNGQGLLRFAWHLPSPISQPSFWCKYSIVKVHLTVDFFGKNMVDIIFSLFELVALAFFIH